MASPRFEHCTENRTDRANTSDAHQDVEEMLETLIVKALANNPITILNPVHSGILVILNLPTQLPDLDETLQVLWHSPLYPIGGRVWCMDKSLKVLQVLLFGLFRCWAVFALLVQADCADCWTPKGIQQRTAIYNTVKREWSRVLLG